MLVRLRHIVICNLFTFLVSHVVYAGCECSLVNLNDEKATATVTTVASLYPTKQQQLSSLRSYFSHIAHNSLSHTHKRTNQLVHTCIAENFWQCNKKIYYSTQRSKDCLTENCKVLASINTSTDISCRKFYGLLMSSLWLHGIAPAQFKAWLLAWRGLTWLGLAWVDFTWRLLPMYIKERERESGCHEYFLLCKIVFVYLL